MRTELIWTKGRTVGWGCEEIEVGGEMRVGIRSESVSEFVLVEVGAVS